MRQLYFNAYDIFLAFGRPKGMATKQPLVPNLFQFFVGLTNIYLCLAFVPSHLAGVPFFGLGTLSRLLKLFIAQNTVLFAVFSEIPIKAL